MNTAQMLSGLKRTLLPIACSAAAAIPVLVWLISVGNPFDYLSSRVPPGQMMYVISKLCGLLAFVLLWLQCMTALARSSPALRGFVQLHRWQHAALGMATFALVIAHLSLFISASSVRTGHLALPLLLPRFDGFFSTYVSVGAIAFWLLIAVVVAGYLRSRGYTVWRWVHRTSFLVFALVFLHGIALGSETRFGLMTYVYAFFGLSLATALCSWLWVTVRRRTLSDRGRQSGYATWRRMRIG